jgi:hypothetical protein
MGSPLTSTLALRRCVDTSTAPLPRITAVTSKELHFPLLLTVVIPPLPVCARAVADYL